MPCSQKNHFHQDFGGIVPETPLEPPQTACFAGKYRNGDRDLVGRKASEYWNNNALPQRQQAQAQ
jgi:hypothetical protein